MKKYIRISAVVILAILALTSCFAQRDPFYDLGKLSQKLTSNYTLEIKTVSPASHTVTETYTVTETDGVMSVHSRIERINQFVVSGGSVTAPDEYKTVTEKDLSPTEVMSGLFEVPAFNFSSESLDYSSIKENGLEMQCTIRLPEKFMGRAIDGENITLTVVYTESAIETMTISYDMGSGNKVTITYTFN